MRKEIKDYVCGVMMNMPLITSAVKTSCFFVVVSEVEEDPFNEISAIVKLEKENPFMTVHVVVSEWLQLSTKP